MQFFLDTAKVEEIEKAWNWGVLDGVTTNPTHIADTGRKFFDVLEDICDIVDGPISAEATATDAEGIIREARRLSEVHENIVVKVPCIREGFRATSQLSKEGIKTNMTLNFTAVQALMAAKVGATYISPFVGRLDNINEDGMQLVRDIRTIYDNYGYETKIIVAAVRTPHHVLQAALAGAEVTTMRFHILEMLYEHPMTDRGLEQFLADWEKVPT